MKMCWIINYCLAIYHEIVGRKIALVMPQKLQLQNGDLKSNVRSVRPRTYIRQHIHFLSFSVFVTVMFICSLWTVLAALHSPCVSVSCHCQLMSLGNATFRNHRPQIYYCRESNSHIRGKHIVVQEYSGVKSLSMGYNL